MPFKKPNTTNSDYVTCGRTIAYRPEHEKIAIKGLVTIEGTGGELMLFFPKDVEIKKCENEGWEVPLATGSVKHEDNVLYWVRAYASDRDDICCKLHFTQNGTKEKLTCTLFYDKDNDQVLLGNIQTKAPF
jgi:hypothetical protein